MFIIFLIVFNLLSFLFWEINTNNAEFISWMIVFIDTILVMSYVISTNLKYRNIIIVSYLLKIGILFINYYSLFPLMYTGADSLKFADQAYQIWNNPNLLFDTYGTMYSPFLGAIYICAGPQQIYAQFLNILISTLGLIYMYKITQIFGVDKRATWFILLIIAFLPTSLILSSVLMRDCLVQNFLIFSLYYFSLYTKRRNILLLIMSFVCLLIASVFHSGVFVLIIGIIYYLIKEQNRNLGDISSKLLFILCVCVALLYESDTILSKFSGLEKDENEIFEQLNDARGGSVYLENLNTSNYFLAILFTPIKMLYFLLSPMIWDFRFYGDLVMFLSDSLVYYFLLYNILKYGKFFNRLYTKSLIIGGLIVLIAFANGTHNTGTAARHRYKVLPVLCILYGVTYSKKNKVYEKGFNNSASV